MKSAEITGHAARKVLDNAGELARQAEVLNAAVKTFLDKVRAIS